MNDETTTIGIAQAKPGSAKPLKLRKYYSGNLDQVLDAISTNALSLKDVADVKGIFAELPASVLIDPNAELKITYEEKPKKGGGKLEFKISWPSKRHAL